MHPGRRNSGPRKRKPTCRINGARSPSKDCPRLSAAQRTQSSSGHSGSDAAHTWPETQGYEQRLPEITDDEEDQSQFFPYFIVRIEEGNTPTDDEPWLVGTTVLFGICDYDKETNGHRTILEMITKITNRFLERPLLDSKFRANQNVSFALQDEDTYPFYFGAIDIKFYVPKIGRSDDWS